MPSLSWSSEFSTDLSMAAESMMPSEALEMAGAVPEGLQVIVSLSGHLSSRVNDGAPFLIDQSGVYFVLSRGRHEGCDRIEPGTLRRYVRVGLQPGSARRHGIDLAAIAAGDCRRVHCADIMVLHTPLTPALKAVATQALVCPLQGGLREVYLAGKGLELVALAAQAAMRLPAPEQARLSGADLERLWQARDLAIRHYQQPLTLHELARQVGTNVNKLTAGFRQVFGRSVFEYIQEYRLEEAYRMLSTGAYNVSEVAAFVGYAIPHFSTLFRRRFGCPPSHLAH